MHVFSAIDARGESIRLERPPERIVSLVPSLTELLASLGLEDEVAGITRFCVRPDHWKSSKRIVGGTKSIRLDRIEHLQPDLIVANVEENTREDVQRMEEIAPVFVTNVRDLSDALSTIESIGRLTNRPAAGHELRDAVAEGFEQLDDFASVRTAYLIWHRPYMTVGTDTFIHDVMSRGGFANAFDRGTRYPTVDEAALIDADLDVILLPNEPFPFGPDHAETFERMLPGVRVRLVDGQLFSWYGSRLIHTPRYLRELREELGV